MNTKPESGLRRGPLILMVLVFCVVGYEVYMRMHDGTLLWGVVSGMVAFVVGSIAGTVAWGLTEFLMAWGTRDDDHQPGE